MTMCMLLVEVVALLILVLFYAHLDGHRCLCRELEQHMVSETGNQEHVLA